MSYLEDEDWEFEGYQPITLFDSQPTTENGVKLKFEIKGTDFGGVESQPENIIDEVVGDGALTIQCDMINVVHGTLNSDGPPATLIVFQFAFLPHGNNHRFKQAEITVTFSAGKVRRISPDNEWTTLPSERQQERSHTVSPSIEAALGPAKAATAYTWQRKETETIKGYAKVTGAIKALGQHRGLGLKKRKNTAFWGLYEDERAKTGIPSLLQTAVVLEREATDGQPLGEAFSAAIKIHGNVDRLARVKEKWENVSKWMSGGTRRGKDITFRPPANRGVAQHPNSLEDEDLDAYRLLIAVREWGTKERITSPDPMAKNELADQPPPVPDVERDDVAPGLTSTPTYPPIPGGDIIPARPSLSDLQPTDVEEDLQPSPAHLIAATGPVDGELRNLRDQLRLVREETKWAAHIIALLGEQRVLLKKIETLESSVDDGRGG